MVIALYPWPDSPPVCEDNTSCPRYLLWDIHSIEPLLPRHLERKFLRNLQDALPKLVERALPESYDVEFGYLRKGEKIILPRLVHNHRQAERVFARKTPYWHDVATAAVDHPGRTVNLLYIQISPFVSGHNKLPPNSTMFRLDMDSTDVTIDLKTTPKLPLSFIRLEPEGVIPPKPNYWDSSIGSPCQYCEFQTMCRLIDRDKMNLEQVCNKEFLA
jgi:hypothetical protein